MLLAGVVVGACSDTLLSSAPTAARAVGNVAGTSVTTLFWLPPMVADPGPFTGTFDGSRSPTARVVCTGATGPACPEVARFDATTPAESRLTVDLNDQSYRAMWKTPATLELGGGRYRLEVWDGQSLLGQADLHVVTTQQQARSVPAGRIALVRGSPFLIKFRLEAETQPTPLPGNPDAPAVNAIELRISPADGQNFQTGHPDLPGYPTSVNDVIVHVAANATVRQINAALNATRGQIVGGVPGVSGSVPATLVVRYSTTTHAQLAAVLEQLRLQPGIKGAMPDAQLLPDVLPSASTPIATTRITDDGVLPWDWGLMQSGTWGMVTSAVTPMWNLNEFVATSGATARVAVIDGGFTQHVDVPFSEYLNPGAVSDEHGTSVGGVIGARFGDGTGIDGVNPFVQMRARVSGVSISNLHTVLASHIVQFPEDRVVNVSMGYNWYQWTPPVDAQESPAAIGRASFDGESVANALRALEQRGHPLPIITASAGNNSNKHGWGFQRTTWSSPLANAAIISDIKSIVVVEAMDRGGAQGLFTNVGGHVMAPGDAVMVAAGANEYKLGSGTSYAAPFVAGVLSYLYSASPGLPSPTTTSNPLLTLLERTAELTDASPTPYVHGFRALMDVDRLTGTDRLLRALLDVDDGSGDGNARVNAAGQVLTATDFDGNGRTGDGEIDMSDFRRFRDHLLDIESHLADFTGVVVLNGGATHPKRDLNGDRVVSAPELERTSPRLDFNGDGILNRDATARMSGALDGQVLTDLGVLQSRFLDAHYTAADLPNLLNSADVTFNLTPCFARAGVTFIRLRARRHDTQAMVHERTVLSNAQVQIVTVPYSATGIDFEADLLAADGTTRIARLETFAPAELGQDSFVTPACLTSVSVSPANQTILTGTTLQFSATVTGNPNTAVTWSATGGTISANGLYTAGSTVGDFTVTATSVGDPSVSATVSVGVIAPVVAPTPALGYQIVSGALAGKYTTPIRYRVRFTNYPGHTVRFTTVAVLDSQQPGWVSGPINQSVLSLTELGPTVVDQYVVDWFAEVSFPAIWQGSSRAGVIIRTTACFFKADGSPMLNASGLPLCSTRETFY